jgi:DNA-binding protein Fis
MKYRLFIEDHFMIDAAKTGQLVPFKFNHVQEDFYENVLCKHYDIEKAGLSVPIREHIVKARREGFSSLILALFAADDLLNENPTVTDVYTYRDKDTNTFRKRYRHYLLTYFAHKFGVTPQQIYDDINLLEQIAPEVLSVDSGSIEIKHNKAFAQFSTAGAKVAGRGGVRHKLLFSELAFYPNTKNMTVAQMVEPTMRQVDLDAGWIFFESTEDGPGTYQYQLWKEAERGRSRFKNRFYGAGFFYTDEELAKIESEFVDREQFVKEYPRTVDDLFKGGSKSFTTESALAKLHSSQNADKDLVYLAEYHGQNYMDMAEMILVELRRLERIHEGYYLYAAIDEAKESDATTLCVLRGRRRALNNGRGGIAGLGIDSTRGDFLADWFERNSSWYILRIKFSRPSKSAMYSNLQVIIAEKLTQLPEWKAPNGDWVSDEMRHFINQMTWLEQEYMGNMLVVQHPNGQCAKDGHNYDECMHHDDFPDAWAMAEDVYVDLNGAPVRQKKPDIPSVPNVVQNLLDKGTMRDRSRYSGGANTSFE